MSLLQGSGIPLGDYACSSDSVFATDVIWLVIFSWADFSFFLLLFLRLDPAKAI